MSDAAEWTAVDGDAALRSEERAVVGPPPPAAVERPRRPLSGAARWAGLLACYLIVSGVWWHRLVPHLRSRALGGGLLDPGLFIWWFQWTPFAIGHGIYPLQTGISRDDPTERRTGAI